MKIPIKIVDNLNDFLKKVIEPIVKEPSRLRSGRELSIIKVRPREALGLFLVCTVGRLLDKEEWTIGSDSDGRDGVVFCKTGAREGESFCTEQVYIPSHLK